MFLWMLHTLHETTNFLQLIQFFSKNQHQAAKQRGKTTGAGDSRSDSQLSTDFDVPFRYQNEF